MTGRAVQIASFDADRKLKLHKTGLDSILNQPHLIGLFIAIYSFIGAYRTGKSFTLSWIERFLRSNINLSSTDWLAQLNNNDESLSNGFKWRGGSRGETQGIWVWSEVFVVDGPSGQRVGLLLMDTQGLFDKTNTEQQDGKIFTLSTLISSIQIFNMKNIMQEDKLANLHLFSEFGRRAIAQRNNSSRSSLKAFQRIIFLIRDWQCPTEFSYGSEGGSDYIKECFDISKEMEGTDLALRRQQIHDSFDQVDCYLMPYPGNTMATAVGNFSGRLSEMEDEFKGHLEKFISSLFLDGMVQPKTVAGTRVLASDLSGYIESYVDLLNSDQTLSAQSIFQATARIHNNVVARDAKKEYRALVNSKISDEAFLSDAEIKREHEGFKKVALEHFEERRMMVDAESVNEAGILDQLKLDIEAEFLNWKSKNELVKARIQNLNETALSNAIKTYSSTMDNWLKNTRRPYVEVKEVTDHHKVIQQRTTDSLGTQLKGGAHFASTFITRLEKLINDHLLTVIAQNDNNRNVEEEKRRLQTELQDEQKRNYEAQRDWAERERQLKIEAEEANQRAEEERRKAKEAKAERDKKREDDAEAARQAQLKKEEEMRLIMEAVRINPVDGEIRLIEFNYASEGEELCVQIHSKMTASYPEYNWMVFVFKQGVDANIFYTNSTNLQQVYVHWKDGKNVAVFRSKKTSTFKLDRSSPDFIASVKKAYTEAQSKYTKAENVSIEARRIYSPITNFQEIVIKNITNGDYWWRQKGFSFYYNCIGSYYVFLIELP